VFDWREVIWCFMLERILIVWKVTWCFMWTVITFPPRA